MFRRIRNTLTGLTHKCFDVLCTKRARFQDCSLLSREQMEGLRVFATTVLRGSESRERTGFLLELDWQNNQVKQSIPIPVDTSQPFWNARGGNRGGRGIAVYDGILYVAAVMSVLKFDRDLNQIGEITHPYLAGLHEIYVDAEGLWLTSTVHDLVIKLDFDGGVIDEWWGSKSKMMQQAFGFAGRNLNLELDFSADDFIEAYNEYCRGEIFHLNTVWAQNGKVYVLSSKKKALIQIRPEPERVILRDNRLRLPHNGILTTDGRIIVNDTNNQYVRIYDLSGKRLKTLSTPIYKQTVHGSAQFAIPGWQRGLVHVADSIYLVGTSPATVFEVDIDRGLIGQICQIDTDVRHSSNGLTVVKHF